jgi:hypothetical protein
MQKSRSAKTAPKSSPDKLSQTGRKVGVELTESQLGQASGGLYGTGKTTKINF